jgi:hypothetical protein
MLTKIEVSKKKALELNLQKFLEKEGYGEISQNLQRMKPISPPDNARDIKQTSVNVSEMKPISPPDNSRDIIYCGVRRQMEGLKLLLRGVPEEWTEVKRAVREAGEERQRLKKEADVLVEEVGEENGQAEVLSLHVYVHKCVYMYALTHKRHAAISRHLLCHALSGWAIQGP